MKKADSEQIRSDLEDAIKRISELEYQMHRLPATVNKHSKTIAALENDAVNIHKNSRGMAELVRSLVDKTM